jgi:hypothetical protein
VTCVVSQSKYIGGMTLRKHFKLLLSAVVMWFAFWLGGLPDYYQQYSPSTMGIACVLISVATSLAAVVLVRHGRDETKVQRAFWYSLYYTVPFAVLDWFYCVWYLGRGQDFLIAYWYLAVFYVSPWLTFIPTAMLLKRGPAR